MEPEASYSLPSPTDTPYRTPSSSQSSRSRRYDDMSPSSTPPPMPDERAIKRRSNDSINTALDENISPLDPRRFTPTLHASLVSEILSLRRDLESRTNDIERLEINLHAAQSENANLSNNALQANKESRSVKRQMQLLEGGTLSALNELAKERDDALNDISDLRKRLDQNQKRAKSQEETAERTQALWDKDKETWLAEKRGLETKIHIAEGRLKVVLSEVANVQHHVPPGSPTERTCHSRNSFMDSPSKGSTLTRRGRRLSANSIHSDSHGGRVSVLSFHNCVSVNLADELAFDELEEDIANAHDHEDGRVSPDALPEEHVRPTSSLSLKARKVLGLPLDFEDLERNNDSPAGSPQANRRRRPSIKYVDTAIQFSPPPSPWPVSGSYHNVTTIPQAEIDFGAIKHMTVSPTPVSPVDSVDILWEKQRPVMVSSACQTIEALPSPPLTPGRHDALATIQESPVDREVMSTIGTQTETEPPPIMDNHSHKHKESEEMVDFKIPLITIIPPGSRPATPQTNVVLPPRTKNAGTQVTSQSLGGYQSTSMQTEEIRVDIRAIVPPTEMPPPPLSSHFRPPISSAAIPPTIPRNKMSTVASLFGSKRTVAGPSKVPPAPLNDSGPLSRDFVSNMPRPVRTSSLFAGFEDDAELGDDLLADKNFPEDDIFSRPTAKFVLRSGKMVSQDPLLEDIGENVATSAGEAAAMETIRLSEDGLPPEMRNILSKGRTSPRKGSHRQNTGSKLKRVPSAKSGNMRRAALISSGTAAHHSSHSQSTTASFDSNNPPPFPVPLRYSSAKLGKSISEGGRSSPGSSNASPTKRRGTKHTRPMLRKARSAPAISPHSPGRRSRSRSPPLDPRVSIVPEMPGFQMPTTTTPAPFLAEPYSNPHEASAPRPSIATGPRRPGTHTKANSDAVSMHQTSVVDSIAQTMVGEWMYKYVRRRKSFGVTDKADWDSTKSVEEISQSVTSNGVRHKRWVWLAPYERAVMWSSKQPISGTALMGKSGRKLTIKSVLDVKDDNPMPKGSIIGQQFNRSILILTPQRALKFTAMSQERHYVWLTALSFLSHSPLSVNELTAIPPPPPPPEHDMLNQPTPSLAGSFRRRPIRDSIRIAKNPVRVGPGPRSFTTDGSLPVQDSRPPTRDYYDPTQDPALPPIIPRHSRKRSNTAPRAPPTSFRSFSAKEAAPTVSGPGSTYSQSVRSTAVYSSDRGLYTPSAGMQSIVSSRRGSEASASGPPPIPAVFLDKDPANTMRMDAFIDGKTSTSSGRPSFSFMRSGQSKRKDLGYWGLETGRDSISPVDSLLHNGMMMASSSTRGSSDSRDPWRGF
ncbi:hypothetical protein LTR10_022132 [Elasticomyces elasticus]|uniref:Pleckstrin homology domain-containing protein n=1 Tax=Exophiala sideris TaxID=1016849 RepID=A0ABR0J723_9EURO|nr:hypothetical protein LTR10_022132 [Elasticomyces elasticus]KAK5029434.1 hypothetical protein LTS07_005896 [Exophiala sideris]KAK5036868.1 hypothetical protein LTR13_005248 [Exophiala sideris]KAK5058064.1 hypothetical protein LTR69_007061 [Exophiala sideris]KAK5182023.1 hypothetical protein LTR44_005624 [Eurotiomycetes sp. CCFEE 6388]